MAVSPRLRIWAAALNASAGAATIAAALLIGPASPSADSLGRAFELLAVPATLLFAMTIAVIAARALGGLYDPIRDSETPAYRVQQRVLANTVEQSMIFSTALLAMTASGGPLVDWGPTAAILFTVARLVFWGGYVIHPYARSPGMSATFTVNGALVAAALSGLLGLR